MVVSDGKVKFPIRFASLNLKVLTVSVCWQKPVDTIKQNPTENHLENKYFVIEEELSFYVQEI
jgi:hypothetical protein